MQEAELNRIIGKRIAELRQRRGMSQSGLASLIESEKQNVSRLERGLVNPGLFYLYKIATAFEITLSELLSLEDD